MAAPTITCTPGGSSDNCYVTAEQADAYFADTLREDEWTKHPATRRARALIDATSGLEHRCGGPKDSDSARRRLFHGVPYDDDQALHFPRTVDENSAGAIVVPDGVKAAVCEQAFYLLHEAQQPQPVDFDRLREEGVPLAQIEGVGSVQLRSTGRPSGIAPRAWEAIQPYVVSAFPIMC